MGRSPTSAALVPAPPQVREQQEPARGRKKGGIHTCLPERDLPAGRPIDSCFDLISRC